MNFCTAINCMDGRVQIPVIKYLQEYFNAEYVDSITEPGPNLILSEQTDLNSINSIFKRLQISIEHHSSVGIAVVGHFNCAGNPASQDEQKIHTQQAVKYLKSKYRDISIIGLWADENFIISKI